MIEYNVPLGKLNRGLAVLDGTPSTRSVARVSYYSGCRRHSRRDVRAGVRALRNGAVAEDEAFLAMSIGWCIEWLQAFFLVADDMMDHSITRRGQPCWYKVPKVGLNACNDCIILEACIYKILKRHASHLPCYVQVCCVHARGTLLLHALRAADRIRLHSCWSSSTMSRTRRRADS